MVDRYYRKIEDVENDIENAMQISSILLKLKEYDDDLGKIDTNENNISSNLGRISTNEGNISSNSSKLNNMDIDVKKDIYKKIFNINNFETTSSYKLIFETHLDFKFTKTGVIKIKANYEYLQLNNSRHTHVYLFKNNNTSFNEKHINHYSNIVNDEFSIPAIECENVHFIIFLVNPFNDNSKITLNKNNTEFIYNDFTKIPKTDYNLEKITTNENSISSNSEKINTNEGNISSNSGRISTNEGNISSYTGSISTNEGNISSNLEKINDNSSDISSNLEKINDLQNSNIKAFYNLDKIFIYDIEKGYQTVDKNNYFHIFEKEIIYNFTKNSYLEIILKVLTEISNYVLIGYFQILCNFYDQDNNLFYTISLSTATGSINKLSTVKSVFIVPINENMSKIKIDFFIAPKATQQNRSAKFIIRDINSNKIYVKYYQKTDEMSIKDIKDSLDKVKDISNDLSEIKSLKNFIYLKNIYFTDFDSTDELIRKELLRFDNDTTTTIRPLPAFIDYKEMEYNFKKDDFIEVECKLIINHSIYDIAKNNLSLYYELFQKSDKNTNTEFKILCKEIRSYKEFNEMSNSTRVTTYTKLYYKVKFDISKIVLRVYIDATSLTRKTYLIVSHDIIENGVNYISVKHYGKS